MAVQQYMKFPTRFLLYTIILGLNAALSYGTTFDYQYVFPYDNITGDPLTVSGTLDGNQNGNFIDNVTNVTMYFNGNQVTGPIYAVSFEGGYTNTPIVSFSAALNNFMFINSDVLNGNNSYNAYFYKTPTLGDSVSSGSHWANNWNSSNWSLQAVPETVPDAVSTIGLLGCVLTGLVIVRRRFVS